MYKMLLSIKAIHKYLNILKKQTNNKKIVTVKLANDPKLICMALMNKKYTTRPQLVVQGYQLQMLFIISL